MQVYGGVEIKLHSFLISVVGGGKRTALYLDRFYSAQRAPFAYRKRGEWAP
jgi:hypothetical protein